jgi:hypothetical protein
VDPDPDPRIHASDYWIQIRFWIPDPDPAIFVIDLQDVSQKQIFLTQFFLPITFEGTLHLDHFSKIKRQKESQNSRNQGFSYYFCMMIEGSGSGSGRPKNMWIRWIWIRIRNSSVWSGCHDRQAHATGSGATATGPTADHDELPGPA